MMKRRPLLLGLGARLVMGGGAASAAQLAVAAASPSAAASASSADRPVGVSPEPVLSAAPLVFPRDHGAHPETGVEWWYVTGVLRPEQGEANAPPAYGFQLTFFRIRRTLARPLASPFAPAQIMLGHVAVTDLAGQRLHHDQRLLRQGFANARTDETDTRVRLGDWSLARSAGADGLSRYQLAFRSEHANVALSLSLAAALPPLLQGRAGWSQKGPQAQHASRYVSEPQLAGRGALAVDGKPAQAVQARCWLDHEWSHAYLGRGRDDDTTRSVGWDWLGLNLNDGSALMLFQMRRQDGSTLWTGGTWRDPAGRQQDLEQQVRFEAQAWWDSPASLARYPVRWRIHTPQGMWRVEALFDAQEVDARRSTGFLYWEGVVRLLDEAGTLKGWGYLEMTGYAGRVPL
ncbi:Predicted secreted hydrolase [Roseateles sp. YR242]|uniref:lipocalin-like domain-containing protein n=1 Tax=Roseateles sp. YR242 TaxID=1855305 RepID=UPI0008BCFFB0|nr:lipocalin-like domain-containing protein [Roseateles sp. YR242]SEK27275.1 Predicted secreted hydrolase [Roseateles sp. YR242]